MIASQYEAMVSCMNESTKHTQQGGLRAWGRWLQEIGISPVSGWRWRRRGWIIPTNIAGRLYVSAQAIADFERRADAGDFAKPTAIPPRTQTNPSES